MTAVCYQHVELIALEQIGEIMVGAVRCKCRFDYSTSTISPDTDLCIGWSVQHYSIDVQMVVFMMDAVFHCKV